MPPSSSKKNHTPTKDRSRVTQQHHQHHKHQINMIIPNQTKKKKTSLLEARIRQLEQEVKLLESFLIVAKNTNSLLEKEEDNLQQYQQRICTIVKESSLPIGKLSRGYFRLKLSPPSRHCSQWLIFFKNLFYQNSCNDAMNIGEGQIMGALFNFFVVKKCPFCIFQTLPSSF